MPRRSTGCEKCRQRKIRCDEQKPVCQRCTDYGVLCPGYRPPASKDIHFVHQTRHVARQAGSELAYCYSSHHGDRIPNVASRTSNARDSSTQYRWRHQFSGVIIDSSAPPTMDNSNLHRVQLLSTFLDLYLPKRRDAKMMSHFAYVSALPNVDLSTPLLQVTVDTLCLAELGSLYDDERCLREAQARYVRALPMLSKELNRPVARQLPKASILTAIVILALCELFDAIAKSNPNGQGWVSHVQGAQMFMKANGPDVIHSPFGWLLFHNIRHSSLCMGLVKREAVFFAEKKWLRVTKELAKTDSYIALYDLALQLPGILERADSLAHTTNLRHDFIALCKDICTLRSDLDAWRARFHKSGMYTIVDVRSMTEFATLCPDRTFVTVFSFSSVQMCSQLQLFVVSCLLMDFTFANVFRLYNHTPGRTGLPDVDLFTSRIKAEFWREMFVCATSYCRSMPFSCEPETASAGRIGTFMLRITQSFFEIGGYERELEWCRGVRRMLEASAVRSPFEKGSRGKTGNKVKNGAFESDVPSGRGQQVKMPFVLDGEYPSTGYVPRLPYGTTDQTSTQQIGLHHTQPRRWNVPPEIAQAALQAFQSAITSQAPGAEEEEEEEEDDMDSTITHGTTTTNPTSSDQRDWKTQQPTFTVPSQRIFAGKPPPEDARVNGVNPLADERQPHAMAMCMASDRTLAGSISSSSSASQSNSSPSHHQDEDNIIFLPLQDHEEAEWGSAMGMLLGHQDKYILRPEGKARKGPLGAMCF